MMLYKPAHWISVLLLSSLLWLAGCSDQPAAFRGSDISGTKLGQQWKLTDMNGQSRDQSVLQARCNSFSLGLPNVLISAQPLSQSCQRR